MSLDGIIGARLAGNAKLRSLFDRVRNLEAVDAAHDFSHILRVAKLTLEIYKRETELAESRDLSQDEVDSCIVTAILHDCVPVAKDSPLRKESSRLASEKAREWLSEHQWNEGQIDLITHAVLTHSFSAGHTPTSLLGRALQDADRLEALGALGLFRTIATGVSMDAMLFDPQDPWAKHRDLDDKRFTIDHFFTKLLKLPASFQTRAAKEEAEKRARFLENFLEQLKREID